MSPVEPAEPIRLLVSDIDGTLLRDDKTLPPGNVDAIVALQTAGVAVSLISARPPSGMVDLAAKLRLTGPLAAFNGGTLFDVDGAIRFAFRLGQADAAWILQSMGTAAGVTPWVFARGAWFAATLDNLHMPRERLASGIDPVVRSDFTGLLDCVEKIVAVSDDHGLLAQLEEEARQTIGARATIARSQAHYLDFTHRRANKGDGIAALAEAFGVDLVQVAAVGDMANDVAMFARAGLAVAMGQSPAEVRAAADFTAAANEQAGVADAIARFIRPRTGRVS
jgi:Cof subfamily protein (haloacid dehalogenase superfamily)